MDSLMIYQTHQEIEIHQLASDVANKDTCDTNAEPEYPAHIAERAATATEYAENSQTTPPANPTATSPQGTTQQPHHPH